MFCGALGHDMRTGVFWPLARILSPSCSSQRQGLSPETQTSFGRYCMRRVGRFEVLLRLSERVEQSFSHPMVNMFAPHTDASVREVLRTIALKRECLAGHCVSNFAFEFTSMFHLRFDFEFGLIQFAYYVLSHEVSQFILFVFTSFICLFSCMMLCYPRATRGRCLRSRTELN